VRRAAGAIVESLESRWLLSAGDLDASFGTGGLVTTGFTGSTVDVATAVAKDASGRIVVAGNQGGTGDVIVARYLSSGALDTSFGNGGKATVDFGGSDFVGAIAIDASGIYLAGAAGNDMALARLTSGGALDTNFDGDGVAVVNLGAGINDSADAIAIVTGGIYIGGTASVAGQNEFAVAKFNASGGSLGSSTTAIGDSAHLTALLADGSDVVAGGYATFGGSTSFTLRHYGATQWTVSTNFGDDSQIASLANHAGNILAIGSSNGSVALAQYTFGGAPDLLFNPGNLTSPSTYVDPTTSGVISVRAGGLDSSGKLVVAGTELDSPLRRLAAVRYTLGAGGPTPDGYGSGGIASSDVGDPANPHTLQAAAVSADGSAVLVGDAFGPDQGSNFGGALLNAAGAVTATFNTDFTGPTTDMGAASVIDSAGRIIVAGVKNRVLDDGVVQHIVLVRYTPAGAIDTTFGVGGVAEVNFGTRAESFQSLALDASGNVLVAGLDMNGGIKVARLVNGTLDTSFAGGILTVTGVTLGDTSAAIRVAADGNKVVVAGTTVTGTFPTANNDFYVRRYNANGTADTSFNSSGVVPGLVTLDLRSIGGSDVAGAVQVLSDGSIVVGGSSHSDDTGSQELAVVRFDSSGTVIGSAFQTLYDSMNNILDGMINSLAVQGTNVIAAGDVSGLVVVVRFNTGTNSFDSSFGSGGVSLLDSLTTRGGAKAVAVDTHNAIGIVTTDDSNDELLVLRLTANGALDTTFSGDGVANTGLISGENDIAGITSNANGNLVAVGSLKVTPLNQDVAVERFQSGYIVNPAVAINGAPASSPEGTAINLTSMVTVGSAPIANYAWSVTKNGNPYTTGSAASFSFTPDDNASYVVTLTVTATDGGTGTAPAQTITVTNVAPTPTIHGAPASSPEGTAINVSATSTDPGTFDNATYAWSVTKNGNPYASGSGVSFSFTPDDNASYVITLTATDNDLSAGTTTATVSVSNVAPTPTIHDAPASSPEGTAINVSATSTDPGTVDTATYAWSVTKNGSPYASGSGVDFSFTPDDNASYVITLTATDKDLSAGTTTAMVSVTNVAPTPTIHGAPALSPEGTAINVSATSTDPGTMDTATYAWSVTKNGSPYASGAGVNFSFTPDDNASYVITLTATDKDLSAGTTTATVSVTNVAPSATINGAPASSPAGTPINLTSTVTDPAGANDPISYAWSVTRNGVAYGTNGTGANYSFTPADAATYVVTLTVNDGDGGSDTKTATINVTPVATGVSATLSGGILTIAGDGAGNTVNVSLNGAGNYHVVIGTQVDQVFAFGAVHNILIQAGAGDDVITIASGVSIPAEVHGGDGNDIIQAGGGDDMLFGEDGNDILTGGSGNDVIIGGEGGDVLSGGNGRDILVGGLGPDIITGDNGDDILIAGATAYNTDPVGLSAIRSIWTGGGSYTTRVNALKSNLLATANLFNDTSIDLLSGNNGQDWIIANVASGGTLDQILGIAGNEVVTDL
jgi:uncharacterized delta-60 repeat protein